MSKVGPREVLLKSGARAEIRTARESDASALIALTHSVIGERGFMVTAPEEFTMSVEAEREWILQHRRRPTWLALVAEAEGDVIGLLNFKTGPRRRLSHHGSFGMSVARDHRGRGIGEALLRTLLEWAQAAPGLEKVSLAVLSTNAPAIALYEKLGFLEEGRRIREVKYADGTYADDVLMCRFLDCAP